MKTLIANSSPQPITSKELKEIENQFKIEFPKYLVDFMEKYSGTSTKEVVYNDKFWVNFFLPLKSQINLSIFSVLETQQSLYGKNEWIPFAIDSGAWIYCLSLNAKTNGQIWINKLNDEFEEPFEFVAINMENFISNLLTEEEAFE